MKGLLTDSKEIGMTAIKSFFGENCIDFIKSSAEMARFRSQIWLAFCDFFTALSVFPIWPSSQSEGRLL